MSRFSIALADKSAAGAMDPVRIVVKRIHFHTQKPVLQTLPAKHRVDAAGKRIKVIGSGLVKLKSLKRFAASAGFKAAKCGCLALLLTALPVFAAEASSFGNEVPHSAAYECTNTNTDYQSGDCRDGGSRGCEISPKLRQSSNHFSSLSIFLTVLLLSIPVGVAARGIYILSRKDYKVKWEWEDWNYFQLLALALLFLRVVFGFAMHGKPCSVKEYSMYWSLLSAGVDFCILYFGGFWKKK